MIRTEKTTSSVNARTQASVREGFPGEEVFEIMGYLESRKGRSAAYLITPRGASRSVTILSPTEVPQQVQV